ncbi:MAG: efflux RND transporter periplasmic adaptor subunit [Prolixibacteraceae bacterium]|jgi:RND family efflux transporter MFP subunit|nr:efflux RND transporter periplasmic adaptor subunit [Prolixibacteraceae bacterium]
MKRLGNLLFALSILAITVSSCSKGDGAKNENKNEPVALVSGKEMVRVIPLTKQEITRTIENQSTLKPFNEVHLAPSVPGKIESIKVEIGDHVQKGQLLVKMDDAQLIQSQIQLNSLETDHSRMETLQKTGSIAQQQYDQLEAQYKVARRSAEYLADNTLLKAPFSGVVSGKYFEPGEIYSGAPVATVGKAAILSLIQIDRMKAIVSISEKYFPVIHKGMKASIRFDVYPEMDFEGEIFRIYPTISPQSRSFEVEISIVNKNNMLRPGMFCRVNIDLDKVEAIVLPALAVLKMQGSNIRYLFIEENGKAKRVEVELGKRFDDKVEVISDVLKIGDRIIINGQARLLDGMEVQVVD